MEATEKLADVSLAEIQGLYGPYSFAEKILQKIWWRGDFDHSHALLTDGRRVEILHPGRWNLQGGPDFRDAKIRLGDGPMLLGDIELHLHVRDWGAHRHARDPAYNKVILHVVLFPDASHAAVGVNGHALPALVLLPLLHHDLDEFASDEVVESFSGTNHFAPEELAQMELPKLRILLRERATRRWTAKVAFAKIRLEKLGWEGACHAGALDVLGYRLNRAPMLRTAEKFPLAHWRQDKVTAEMAWLAEIRAWRLSGVRPANYPHARLRQYAAWVKKVPDWPQKLLVAGESLSGQKFETGDTPRVARREGHFTACRLRLFEDVGGTAVSGDRFDTLLCDSWLPLLVAHGQIISGAFWEHWFPGDVLHATAGVLRQLGIFDGRDFPAAHGPAQGLLQWWIEKEAERLRGWQFG